MSKDSFPWSLNTEGPERNDTNDANTAAENSLCLLRPGRPSPGRSMRRRGRSLLLLRLRTRPPGGKRTRPGPQTLQHRRRPRVRRDLLGPPRVLPADEGHRRRLPHSRLRERPGPSAAVRSRLALAGGDREGLPNPSAPPSPRRRRGSPRVPQGPMGGRGVAPLPAAGRVTVLHKIYRGAAASIRGGPHTPRSLQETLQQLPTEVLRDLARAHRIDRGRQADRALLIETIMALPDGDAVLAAQGLLDPCDPADPEAVAARKLLERVREALVQGPPVDEQLLQGLVRASESAHAREAERVREHLAGTRDAIREAANLGASVALAEDAWNRGADFLDRGRLRAARESFQEASQNAEDARLLRIREVEDSVDSVSGHIELARNVGAETLEAEGLHAAARAAIAAGEHGQAGDLLRRAERLAMKGQQRQIERAIQLRAAQVEKAQAILNACEPVLKEAESYDLSAAEVRTLLRQARDVLTKGDYLAGLTFARNAEEAARHLEAQIQEERRRRGIQKPRSGICGVCRSRRVTFQDDGWGRCAECGNSFRWRGPLGVLERLRDLLTP